MVKEKKIEQEILKYKSYPLITNLEDLAHRVSIVTVKEAELKMLVKRQTQLHILVHHQKNVRISASENGRRKTSSALLKELSEIIVSKSAEERNSCL